VKPRRRKKKAWKLKLFAEQDGLCAWCEEPMNYAESRQNWMVTLDHVVALKDGGRDRLDNLVAAHWRCNMRRHRQRSKGGMTARARTRERRLREQLADQIANRDNRPEETKA
jgi:5-methylcytosine-specific restriction endonuclease McrA